MDKIGLEADALGELGVIEGEAWTLKRWIKEVKWKQGGHQKRAAMIMVMAYEHLRQGHRDVALATLVQGIKALRQSATANGQWSMAIHYSSLQCIGELCLVENLLCTYGNGRVYRLTRMRSKLGQTFSSVSVIKPIPGYKMT